MNNTRIMTKINYDYFSVYDKEGNKIMDCGTEYDAVRMLSFGEGRTYKKINYLSDYVVDTNSSKLDDDLQLKEQKILPEKQEIPSNP